MQAVTRVTRPNRPSMPAGLAPVLAAMQHGSGCMALEAMDVLLEQLYTGETGGTRVATLLRRATWGACTPTRHEFGYADGSRVVGTTARGLGMLYHAEE